MGKVRNVDVAKSLKFFGYSIQKDAAELVHKQLENVPASTHDDWIDNLVDSLQRQTLKSNILDFNDVKSALKDLQRAGGQVVQLPETEDSKRATQEEQREQDKKDSFFRVIDAFEVPRFIYDCEAEKYIKETQQPLMGGIDSKVQMFRERYNSVLVRTLRHRLFSAGHRKAQTAQFSLQKIEYLKVCTTKMKDIVVLGMLNQMKEGEWWIEDPSGAIIIDMKDATFHKGLFTESSMILVEGTYDNGVIYATAFGFPPPESAAVSRSYHSTTNFFGGERGTNIGSSERMQVLERDCENSVCFLSGIHLDDDKSFNRLVRLLEGFAISPPIAFVICGELLASPHMPDSYDVLSERLEKLGRKAVELNLRETHFVFIPSSSDPGLGDCLPRPSIPDSVIPQYVQQKLPNWTFSSNPSRITLFSQEIVVYRADIVAKLMRHAVRMPAGDLQEMSVKTILSQAHLSPLPQRLSPIYWAWDHALRLFPLPDVLVLADSYQEYNLTSSGVVCLNPSSFAKDGSFHVYYPNHRNVEVSKVPL